MKTYRNITRSVIDLQSTFVVNVRLRFELDNEIYPLAYLLASVSRLGKTTTKGSKPIRKRGIQENDHSTWVNVSLIHFSQSDVFLPPLSGRHM